MQITADYSYRRTAMNWLMAKLGGYTHYFNELTRHSENVNQLELDMREAQTLELKLWILEAAEQVKKAWDPQGKPIKKEDAA